MALSSSFAVTLLIECEVDFGAFATGRPTTMKAVSRSFLRNALETRSDVAPGLNVQCQSAELAVVNAGAATS
jgi:hypothetical protein